VPEYSRSRVNTHVTLTCGGPIAIGVMDSREDTLKVHMYWLNVQVLRVQVFVVYCLLFNVCTQAKKTHTCDVDMRTAARYIRISDTAMILQPKGRH